jgi:hypothetical protein
MLLVTIGLALVLVFIAHLIFKRRQTAQQPGTCACVL